MPPRISGVTRTTLPRATRVPGRGVTCTRHGLCSDDRWISSSTTCDPRSVDYTKYPRTWHLPDSPNRGADGDHAHADYSPFAGREVVVTEKLDGENTTIYADGHCHARSVASGYHPTRTWVRGSLTCPAMVLRDVDNRDWM